MNEYGPPNSGNLKHEKFQKLAENRVNKAIVAISRVGNLSNRRLYEWRSDEVQKIMEALKKAVSEVENRFSSPRSDRFKLTE